MGRRTPTVGKRRTLAAGAAISSMTGFGGAEASADGVAVRVDLRTVNNRYFKLQTRFSDELAHMAGPAENEVRRLVKRGSVNLTARADALAPSQAGAIDTTALDAYVKFCTVFAAEHRLETGLTAAGLLRLPGVIRAPEETLRGQTPLLERLLTRALAQALENLAAMRCKEGAALAAEMLKRLRTVERTLGPIARELPAALAELQARVHERVNAILAAKGMELEEGAVAREIAFLAERTDVAEEIDRLRSHTAQTRELLEKGGEIGRQLDFLTQEMLREASTMGAKVGTSGLAQRVMTLKVEIDRLREQAQNIE